MVSVAPATAWRSAPSMSILIKSTRSRPSSATSLSMVGERKLNSAGAGPVTGESRALLRTQCESGRGRKDQQRKFHVASWSQTNGQKAMLTAVFGRTGGFG